MASLILPLAAGSTKADGTVNAGGRVYLYSPGTSIAIDAYADRDKSALATRASGGYYALDPAGRAYLWVDAPCTVREETSSGTLVKEYQTGTDVNAGLVEVINDGFTGTASDGSIEAGERTYLDAVLSRAYASFGGLDFKFRGLYGSVDRAVGEELEEIHLSVKRFGAAGNGVADDTSALQSAINAAAAAGSGVVFLGVGTYKITSALLASGPVRIRGAGLGATVIRQDNTTANGITYSGTGTLVVEDLTISAGTTSTGTAIAQTSTGAGNAVVTRVSSALFRKCITLASGGSHAITNCSMIANPGDANGVAISITSNSFTLVVGGFYNAVLDAVSIAGDGATVSLIGGNYSGTGDGIDVSVANVALTAAGAILSGGTNAVSLPAQSGVIFRDVGSTYQGAVSDSRNASPVIFTVASTSTVTTLPLRSNLSRIVATAAGITVTLGNTTAMPIGGMHTVVFVNASGGAVTWAMGTDWILTAAGVPTPATGTETAIIFQRSGGRYREVGTRATTTT